MQVGDALNERFVLHRYIGRGSRGECWLVNDRQGDEKCLTKIYRINQGNWASYDLIEREAQLLRQLNHPMIPKFHDLFVTQDNTALCLVREYVPGQNLEQYLEEKRISEVDVRMIAAKLLDVLSYIHGLSPAVLHRDLKPSNIILRPDDSLSLIDFGSVRDSINAEEGLSVMGAYGYTPPEQFLGRPSPASDLYALGATLLFLLSRHHPIHLPLERNRIQFEPYINVQPRFLRILQKLLSPNVEDRFQSPNEVLPALQRCEPADQYPILPKNQNKLEQTTPSSISTPSPPHPKRPWQKNRDLPKNWQWERAEEKLEYAYQPDLQAVVRTLEQRYCLEGLDAYSEALDVISASDKHFGFHDETGRQWLLRLLHPHDAADLLLGFYTPDFILPRYAKLLMERFSLLHAHSEDNAIGQWTLLYFLHKHGWEPQELWYENEQLPFKYSYQRLFGTLHNTRRFVDAFQLSSIGKQAQRFEKLTEHTEHIKRIYKLCVSLHPSHLPLIVEKGVLSFENEALTTYPPTWQQEWRNTPQLKRSLRRLTLWPPPWLALGGFLDRGPQKYHRLGAYISGIYFLYHDLDLLRIRLQEEYHWLLPESPSQNARLHSKQPNPSLSSTHTKPLPLPLPEQEDPNA